MTRSGPQGQDRRPEQRPRTPPAPAWRAAEALALCGIAGACFAVGRNLSLDWTDEGHIIYPIWRVSQGALPYVDVRQLYAPSLFFLNGALLRWFGADLSVIRISLVVVKALLATLVYVNARLIASRLFALLAYGLAVVVWMTPWWVFNTPYANHYGLVWGLAAVYGFLLLRRRHALACLWAGLCCGIGATFKQTSGLFTFLAFAVFLLWNVPAPDVRSAPHAPPRWQLAAARALRWATLIAALGLCIAYVAPRDTLGNAALLLAPIAAALVLVARRELRGVDPATQVQGALGVLYAGVAMLLPVVAYGVYYAARGHLGELLADTLSELPRRTNWFDPLPLPPLRAAALIAATLSFLAAARLAATSADRPGRRRAALAALGLGGVALIAAVVHAAHSVGLGEYARLLLWYDDVFAALYALPFAVVWALLVIDATSDGEGWAPSAEDDAAALGLWSFFSAINLLLLYPAGDRWHLLMSLPAFLPPFAYLLERYARVPDARAAPAPVQRLARWLPTLASVGLVAAICAPFVGTLRFVGAVTGGVRGEFARASGIRGWPPKFGAAADLVDYLAGRPAETELLVLCDEQMLYFLAGRRSVMERDEFTLYLVTAGVIEPADRRALIDEQDMVARLQRARPLVIDCAANPRAARFKEAFPLAASALAEHFRIVASFGEYQVLAWSEGG